MRKHLLAAVFGAIACAQAGEPPERVSGRLVDCGHDFFRQTDGRPMIGSLFVVQQALLVTDSTSGLWKTTDRYVSELATDVDGDGRTDDDVVFGIPFSLEARMNPDLPWYDGRAANARWFGGIALAQGDRRSTLFTEDGVNDETVIPHMAPRDNWTLFHELYDVNGPYRFHAVLLWKKEDFLSGGARGNVSFEAESVLALYTQRYWMGFDGVRFVVQDGDSFFVSEASFSGAGQEPYGYANGRQHTLKPLETRWAPYTPAPPFDIRWKPSGFAEHRFTDVRAVGFYLFKDTFIPAYTGFKWYAFEASGVVEKPARAAESTEMIPVPASAGIPAFYIGRTEVPYLLWKDVFRRARHNAFVQWRGFVFERDGDMGSMDADDAAHRLDEPATDLTLPDALAWCNALSYEEGRRPCYYEDAAFTIPFREVMGPCYDTPSKRRAAEIFVDWKADGFRLPTPSEWLHAAGGAVPAPAPAPSTAPVVAGQPDARGLFGMAGNARELVWTFGDVFRPGDNPKILAIGGDYRAANGAPYSATGFRIVRRASGQPAPSATRPASANLSEVADAKPAAPAFAPPEMARIPGIPIAMSNEEVSYRLWRAVRDRAAEKGYSFDHDGDMGSMDWWGFADVTPAAEHSPAEPVTDISAYDAMAWCNALSELAGLTPVYYEDEGATRVYRAALVYRPLMQLDFEVKGPGSSWHQTLHARADADGYRLPSPDEYAAAVKQGGGATRIANRADAEGIWLLESCSGGTRPAGSGRANGLGIRNLEGNVLEYTGRSNGRGQQACFGTSFLDPAANAGSAAAKYAPSGWGYPDLGFRIVRATKE